MSPVILRSSSSGNSRPPKWWELLLAIFIIWVIITLIQWMTDQDSRNLDRPGRPFHARTIPEVIRDQKAFVDTLIHHAF